MTAEAKAITPGTLVRLVPKDAPPLGIAIFNPNSLVAARIIERDVAREIDGAWFGERLGTALALRDQLFDRPYYRLCHAEADGMPGLVIDRFGDVLVCQANSAGMDRMAEPVLRALASKLSVRAVIMRNDSAMRQLEGLKTEVRFASGSLSEDEASALRVEEGGAVFFADLLSGQKTGWFFDQRDHRAAVARLASGARVLDAYCHTGGFGVQAALGGAAEVRLLDRSKPALALAEKAAAANGVADRCRFEVGDVFRTLEAKARAGERYDIVVADPPAFVKSKRDLASGAKGYRKLTKLAADLVRPEGFLFIASCSHNMDADNFQEQVRRGLTKARRNGRIIRFAGAASDHPVHPFLPESAYLKGMILQLD